ncbi:MAG: hypothetical protein ABIG96_05325 [Candidatus Micrarchaeota archaeon]
MDDILPLQLTEKRPVWLEKLRETYSRMLQERGVLSEEKGVQ